MTEFLTHLAALSLGGALAALALMAAGRLTRSRYAARWRCLLWALLCLRLALPLPLPQLGRTEAATPIQLPAPSDVVIYQQRPDPSSGQTDPIPQVPAEGGAGSSPSSLQPDSAPSLREDSEEETGITLSLSQVLTGVWALGCGVVLAGSAAAHLRLRRYLKRWAAPVERADIRMVYNRLGDQLGLDRRPSLLACPGLAVPMLAGLLHPTLLLPDRAPGGKELEYALLHELTHYRRRDIWLKALALIAAAVHWFNPVIWLTLRWVERDTELSCDEAALRRLPPEEHTAYGQTILSAVERLNVRT